jgi:hypothetical protein
MAMAHTVSCKRFSTNYLKQSNETGRQLFSLTNQLLQRLSEVESVCIRSDLSSVFDVVSCKVSLKKCNDLNIGKIEVTDNASICDVKIVKIKAGQSTIKCTVKDPQLNFISHWSSNKWSCECNYYNIITTLSASLRNLFGVKNTPGENTPVNVPCLLKSSGQHFEITFIPKKIQTYHFQITPTGNNHALYQFTVKIDAKYFIGCRVKRGSNWQYDYDMEDAGGDGNIGTIIGLADGSAGRLSAATVKVVWDSTNVTGEYNFSNLELV